eukprot:10905316-Karenia_brevis.AAC.1
MHRHHQAVSDQLQCSHDSDSDSDSESASEDYSDTLMRYEAVWWDDFFPIRIGWATKALLDFKCTMLEELQQDISWDVLLQASKF